MNEAEFLQRWKSEKTMYDAWGDFVVNFICEDLQNSYDKDLNVFLKVPVKHRVKGDDSLIDKAFYRSKSYKDPYVEIEDKVGARFVVMLVNEITEICDIISKASDDGIWDAIQCRDFVSEREASPTLFTYQSDHFIIRSNKPLNHKGIDIDADIPCEIQIRTLLQHAYAELTHDVIYKKKMLIKPDVHRTVAKTMAFIETADDFFSNVTRQLNEQPDRLYEVQELLNTLYFEMTGEQPVNQKSSLVIFDEFQNCMDENLDYKIRKFVRDNPHISEVIKERRNNHAFYNQSIIIFVYYLVRYRRTQLGGSWPLEWQIITEIALELGVALDRPV